MGVDASGNKDQSWGQGIMFGYACKETPSLMPAPIYYSHKILEQMALIESLETPGIQPDRKAKLRFNIKMVNQKNVQNSRLHSARCWFRSAGVRNNHTNY